VIRAMTSATPVVRRRPANRVIAGTMAIVGGAMVAIGVALPWFSLFAGLRPVTAAGTLNGTLLLVGAAIAGGLGLLVIVRGSVMARRALMGMGIAGVAFGAYLVVGLVSVYRTVSADPLLVAQPGPGLALVAFGALLILATVLIGD
jgi:hypothetical protein